ncbi:MAG: hypothetical protein ACREUQ_09200 [Burkholderiales bacterium]
MPILRHVHDRSNISGDFLYTFVRRQRHRTMRSVAPTIVAVAAIFALVHIIVVAVPVLMSGGSGETQAFAVAIFDLPIFWLLGLFPAGRTVLYGTFPSLYILVFSVGGTLMYAAIGAFVGRGIHFVIRALRAA